MKLPLTLVALLSILLDSGLHGVTAASRQPAGILGRMAPAMSCYAGADYGDANGIALDARGNVYTALGAVAGGSETGVEIQKWSSTGRLLATWTTPGARAGAEGHPVGIAVDARGNVYVSDANAGHIDRLSATGHVTAAWGTPGTAPDQLDTPAGLAIDGRGDLYEADKGNSRIQVFDMAGQLRVVWHLPSPAPRQASQPSAIAIGGDGRVYVADEANRILVLSPGGALLRASDAIS